MGIYDRDYVRARPARLRIPGGEVPVWAWLIAANVAVFLLQSLAERSGARSLIALLTLVPSRVVRNLELWRLVTSAFLHGGPMHLLFNMLFLWWFGREIEGLYGRREFLWFYFVSAVFASLIYALTSYFILAPWYDLELRATQALGASGAILAVVTLFALHAPNRRIFLWGIIPIPIWLFLAILIGEDLSGFVSRPAGVAHGAHLGGVAIGALFRFVDLRASTIRRRIGRIARPPRRDRGEGLAPLADEIDEILGKISRQGMSSLTPAERRALLRASEERRRR